MLDTGPGMKDLLATLQPSSLCSDVGDPDGHRVPSSFLDTVLAADIRPS
ncbi:hypothetical protein P9209_08200 [Prescottella defluvii]|nr:hypothetical protein P9209_08200 [Prescottella defluvii]